MILIALFTSCPVVDPPGLFDDGNIIVQVLEAEGFDGAQFICYVFEENSSINNPDMALGCGINPGTFYSGRAEVKICDKKGSGEPVLFTGGEFYKVYGFIDVDLSGVISEGDYTSRPDFTEMVDGETIITFHFPKDFALVLPEAGPKIAVSISERSLYSGENIQYGAVPVSTRNPIIFTVNNPGNEILELGSGTEILKFSGSQSTKWLVEAAPDQQILPGESSSFSISFEPENQGDYYCQLFIEHNGLYVSPFVINFSGKGIVPAVRLPVTGMINSHITQDDGDVQYGVLWPSTRFSDNGDNTISDELTGLMWEKVPSVSKFTWQNALIYAAALDTAGYTDWRLPNVNELASLLNANTYDNESFLESHGFQNLYEDYYWSSTTFAPDSDYAWIVDLGPAGHGSGAIDSFNKNGEYNNISQLVTYRSICVRGESDGIISLPKTGQTTSWESEDDGDLQSGTGWPTPRFIENGNGTITDLLTGLMWDQSPGGPGMYWETAVLNAVDINIGGYSDWRLPNRSELRSLINYGMNNTVVWLNNSDFYSVYQFHYWSSTPYPAGSSHAWIVYMIHGHLLMEYKEPGSGFLKPAWYVRGN